MVNKRKQGLTQARAKLTSHRMRSATVGTHMPHRSGRYMNGQSVGFSSPRKQKRAARGMVDTIMPRTTTGESSSQFAHRVSRREFTQEIQRRVRLRRILVLVACLLVVICIAAGVGVAAFFGSLDAKLALKDSNVASALVVPKAAATSFYTVVAADLDTPGSASAVDGPDAIALVRVDKEARRTTVVSIPPTLQVPLKDGKTHSLREAQTLGGDAALVSAVATFAGVDVAHYVKIDAPSIVRLVDALGGVEVNVSEEVDDPNAGNEYLAAGEQTLNGAQALTFARASNFSKGIDAQAANQRTLLTALSLRLVEKGSIDFLTTLDSVGGSFQTDVPITSVLSIAQALGAMDVSSVYGALVPGSETSRNDTLAYRVTSDSWKSMMKLVDAGEQPVTEKSTPKVDPGSFSITVRNGAEITGGAAQMADALKGFGFNVVDTGNMDSPAYKETLVVYKDDAFKEAAQTVVASLGVGRAVAGAGFYTFNTDVLVVLGKDWKPTS